MPESGDSSIDNLWREYGRIFRDWDDLTIGRWMAQTLGFHGFTAWVPTLLVAHGFSLVKSLAWSSAMSIGTIPGAFIAAMISDRWDRKWLIPGVALLIARCRTEALRRARHPRTGTRSATPAEARRRPARVSGFQQEPRAAGTSGRHAVAGRR